MITKKGRKVLSLYMKDFEFIYAYVCFCFAYIEFMRKWFWEFKQKEGEGFWNICLIYAYFSLLVDAYICFDAYICLVSCASLNILFFIAMHELRGSFFEAWL